MSDAAPIPEGLIVLRSRPGPTGTRKSLECASAARGLAVFARIDHAAGAKSAGLDVPPTGNVIFCSPQTGTPLMRMSDLIGLQSRRKALIRQDAERVTVLAYDDPARRARLFGLADSAAAVVVKMQAALAAVTSEAAAE
jgi:uncharacterized protein (DUF302 family)